MPYANADDKREYERQNYHKRKKDKPKPPTGPINFKTRPIQPLLCQWGTT